MNKRRTKEEYAALLADPRWQRVRLTIFNRDEWACRLCGSKSRTLSVHHIKYTTDLPWNESRANLVCVCESCHGSIKHCQTAEEEGLFRKRLLKTQEAKAMETQFSDLAGNGLRLVTASVGEDD